MASKNLGTLTLDLVARIGGFTGPMDQATRQSQKRMKEIQNSARNTATAIKAIFGALAVGATFAKVITETQRAEQEQAQLAAVLRSTGEAAGYSRDQLNAMADSLEGRSIFSAGDINQAQTTLLAFTNIVGEEYERAMQSVIDMSARTGQSVQSVAETIGRALDTPSEGYASLSRQGFRFTEEQKKVIQALEATGKTAEAQAIILEALESTYGGAAQAARDTFGGSLQALRNTINALLTGEDGSLEAARGGVESLNRALLSSESKEAFAAIIAGLTSITRTAVEATSALVKMTQWAGESLAAFVNGPAIGDLDRIESRLTYLQDIASKFQDVGKPIPETTLREMDELNYKLEQTLKLQEGQEDASRRAAEAAARAREAANDEAGRKRDAQKAAEQAALAAQKEAEEREKAAKATARQAEQIRKQIEALQFQANTVGMTSDAVTLLRLELDGATDAQLAQAAAALNTVSAYEAQAEAIQKLNDAQEATNKEAVGILNSLMSEEDQLRQSYERRKQIILDATLLTEEQRQDALRGLQENFDEEMLELNGSFWEKYLAAAEDQLTNFDELASNVIENTTRKFGDAFESMIFDSKSFGDAATELFASLARSAVNALGQMAAQWLAYQAVQLLVGRTTQASASSTLIANAQATSLQASLAAFASTAAIPIVGPVLAPAAAATAAAATAPFVAGITAASLAGMAHDGIDAVPETGTWLLQKGERVTTAETSAKLDKTLDEVRNGSGGDVKIFNYGNDNVTAQKNQDGDWEVMIVRAENRIAAGIRSGKGAVGGAIEGAYGVARVGR